MILNGRVLVLKHDSGNKTLKLFKIEEEAEQEREEHQEEREEQQDPNEQQENTAGQEKVEEITDGEEKREEGDPEGVKETEGQKNEGKALILTQFFQQDYTRFLDVKRDERKIICMKREGRYKSRQIGGSGSHNSMLTDYICSEIAISIPKNIN